MGGGGGSNGHAAMSALGSGRACPTAVIAFCPSSPVYGTFTVCIVITSSTLVPAPAALALWALLGDACILVH